MLPPLLIAAGYAALIITTGWLGAAVAVVHIGIILGAAALAGPKRRPPPT